MNSIMITGASGGIGSAVAEKFLAEGWQVGLLARREDKLRILADGHTGAYVLPADVTKSDEVEPAFNEFFLEAGRIDVLFNNAGVFTPATTIDQMSLEDWQRALDVNLTGMFLAARAAFARMRRQTPQGGRIINNGSVSAHVPRPGSAAYTATKHGVTGLTKSLSLDGRAFDIACGQIDIGNARTPLLEDATRAAIERGEAPPPHIDVKLVADAVYNMAVLPPEANVQFMTLMATKMPYIGRG